MMMNKEEIYTSWAPSNSVWSSWAKPILFAHLDLIATSPRNEVQPPDANWAPPAAAKVAIVLDLPGVMSAREGLALAIRGYRPVPLFNAVPLPGGYPAIDSLTGRPLAAVDVAPILALLRDGAAQLSAINLPSNAPPAFLLDAGRAADGRTMEPDEFDNRSVSFTTDFPSANFLASQGITRAILVQRESLEPRADLAHTLRRWQDGGIKLERMRFEPACVAEPFSVSRPTWYGSMFQRTLARLGLRRAASGGFGAWVPDASAGG